MGAQKDYREQWQELGKYGVPLLVSPNQTDSDLRIDYDPSVTFVQSLSSGGTGYVLWLRLTNNSRRDIWIEQWEVRPPWRDPSCRMLDDPEAALGVNGPYIMPGNRDRYLRCQVLNHHVDARGRLRPGQPVDGYLLAIGNAAIPVQYRGRVQLSLIVSDTARRLFSQNIEANLDRSAARVVMRSRGTSHSGLFERDGTNNQTMAARELDSSASRRHAAWHSSSCTQKPGPGGLI